MTWATGSSCGWPAGRTRWQLAEFSAEVQADEDLPGELIHEWSLELFEVPPPSFRAEDDITVVEDTTTGRIVSTICLIPQTWSYDGVRMAVGQPELVATHPDYRRRGLVRAQFDVIHERSEAAGHQWQFIDGLPWYYRQFGYSYALDLPPPPIWRPSGDVAHSPAVALRPAVLDDVGFLARVTTDGMGRGTLGCVRDHDAWVYELSRRPGALPAGHVLVLERREQADTAGRPIGYVVHSPRLRNGNATVWAFELAAGENWLEPTAAVLAHLVDWARTRPDGHAPGVRLLLPAAHPARRCAATRLHHGVPGTIGFYVRVRDLAAFLLAVREVLEARIAESPVVGWSGLLGLGLYTERLCLRFDAGRLLDVSRRPPLREGDDKRDDERDDANLPVEAFLHLLFGNRSLHQVEATTADCELQTDTGAAFLDALFPRLELSPWTMG